MAGEIRVNQYQAHADHKKYKNAVKVQPPLSRSAPFDGTDRAGIARVSTVRLCSRAGSPLSQANLFAVRQPHHAGIVVVSGYFPQFQTFQSAPFCTAPSRTLSRAASRTVSRYDSDPVVGTSSVAPLCLSHAVPPLLYFLPRQPLLSSFRSSFHSIVVRQSLKFL